MTHPFVTQFPPNCGAGGFQSERFVACRVAKTDASRVQSDPLGEGSAAAVPAVADDRPTANGELHSNLMFSSRLQRHLQQSAGCRALQATKLQRRLEAAGIDRLHSDDRAELVYDLLRAINGEVEPKRAQAIVDLLLFDLGMTVLPERSKGELR